MRVPAGLCSVGPQSITALSQALMLQLLSFPQGINAGPMRASLNVFDIYVTYRVAMQSASRGPIFVSETEMLCLTTSAGVLLSHDSKVGLFL